MCRETCTEREALGETEEQHAEHFGQRQKRKIFLWLLPKNARRKEACIEMYVCMWPYSLKITIE